MSIYNYEYLNEFFFNKKKKKKSNVPPKSRTPKGYYDFLDSDYDLFQPN